MLIKYSLEMQYLTLAFMSQACLLSLPPVAIYLRNYRSMPYFNYSHRIWNKQKIQDSIW